MRISEKPTEWPGPSGWKRVGSVAQAARVRAAKVQKIRRFMRFLLPGLSSGAGPSRVPVAPPQNPATGRPRPGSPQAKRGGEPRHVGRDQRLDPLRPARRMREAEGY